MTAPGPLERFHRCLPLILAHEGGYVNHPADPGGATNKGVTQRVYDAWRRSVGRVPRSVKSIEASEVSDIYHDGYWFAAKCDKLPAGVDYMVFDCAVNQGVGRAARLLQQALGVEADGKIGPKTLAAVAGAAPVPLIQWIGDAREAHYRSLKTFATFGKGWMRRLDEVSAKAEEMAVQ